MDDLGDNFYDDEEEDFQTWNGLPGVAGKNHSTSSAPGTLGAQNSYQQRVINANTGALLVKRKSSRHVSLPITGTQIYASQSALEPIVVCGKKWTCRLSISSLLPDESAAKTLRETFELVKQNADAISLQALRGLFDKLPGAADKFARAGRIRHVDDDWELINHGHVVLSSIEKCITRARDVDLLRDYLNHLAKIHNHVGVRSVEIPVALHHFESAILCYLRLNHSHAEALTKKLSAPDNSRRPSFALAGLPVGAPVPQLAFNNNRGSSSSTTGENGMLSPGFDRSSFNNNNGNFEFNNETSSDDRPTPFSVCSICTTWYNFFDLINILMVTDMKE